ncbi:MULTISPECIES: GntP family permease [Brachybacterium]|uniref:GntP family permease n=2 Tax=Brachybacterium TaxID=43668 RepID=A0A426SLM6_9MICO|nr:MULTISPECIES: GntP family permease [Brachybacterium]MCT1435835.1 GntP family permease [Brachybacterium paraconglomeratum]RRR19108.1 GntP family permease [Brachybacterium paraconglomeratum]GLI29586.1 gluconate transporter [Brachybacterium conglomeratum]GLK06177.1 gluconate transporter [Brachybacterium conglomeratum]
MEELVLAERPVWLLLTIAVVAIAFLLFLIIKTRLHAFFSLLIVAVLTGLAAGIGVADVIDVVIAGFSSTVGTVALLVGFGAVLGRIIEVTGGAQVLADKMLDTFGEKRAPLALSVASLFYAFPIFLDAGFIVMLPVIYTVARRLGGSFMLYVLPSIASFMMMHALLPPHPGPTAAATVMGADIGLVIIVGLLIGLPTWYFGGYLVARAISKRFPDTPVPALLGEPREVPVEERPAFGAILLVLLMPLALIFFNTGLSTMEASGSVSDQNALYQLSRLVGATPVAMALSALTAMLVLYVIPRRRSGQQVGGLLEELVDDALAPVCSIILITGAGGAFGRVLTETGIGGLVAEGLDAMGLPLIIAAYLVTMAMRIAQGSATVAATTGASIMAPAIMAGDFGTIAVAAVVIAIGAASIGWSHVNDSGFWLIGKFCGFDTITTFKTWSLIGTTISLLAFALSSVVFVIAA